MNRPFRRVVIAAFVAFCMLFVFTGVQAAENNEVAKTIQNIGRYSRGINLGMTFAESVKTLGAPKEKAKVPGPGNAASPAYYATWLQTGYSVDAQFNRDDRVVSYGIHWFGKAGSAPEFKDILEGKFTEASLLGTRTATLAGADVVISWRKTPVPNSDKFIDVLTVAKKH